MNNINAFSVLPDDNLRDLCSKMDIKTLEKFLYQSDRNYRVCYDILRQHRLAIKDDIINYHDVLITEDRQNLYSIPIKDIDYNDNKIIIDYAVVNSNFFIWNERIENSGLLKIPDYPIAVNPNIYYEVINILNTI